MEKSRCACPRTSTPMLLKCKVCSNSARYSYYGAIVCLSCKMFFKRNAERRQSTLKCFSNTHCQMHFHTRPMCPCCRWKKCFAVGMRSDMIRTPHSTNKTQEKKGAGTRSTSTDLVPFQKARELEQIPPLNLPRSSRITLNTEQWNLLSNITHCFDQYVENSFGEHFVAEQNALPLKLRFKTSSVKEFFIDLKIKLQLHFERNKHFLSLSSEDRQGLLRSTVEHTTGLGGMFILRRHQLFNHLLFYKTAETIFRPNATLSTKHVISQLDPDETFIKLIIVILSFSTIDYTVYKKFESTRSINTKKILPIQDIYTEITWRYLVYQYGHEDAVRRFANIIRCLFLVNHAIVEARKSQEFTDIIETVIKQTEQILIV